MSTSKWSDICNYSLGNITSGDTKSITIYLCKALRNLANDDEDRIGPPACTEQVIPFFF